MLAYAVSKQNSACLDKYLSAQCSYKFKKQQHSKINKIKLKTKKKTCTNAHLGVTA